MLSCISNVARYIHTGAKRISRVQWNTCFMLSTRSCISGSGRGLSFRYEENNSVVHTSPCV